MERMTLEQIEAIEPEVAVILAEAKKQAHRWNEVDRLYEEYKTRFSWLVGWCGTHKDLRDCSVYETVIKALRDALDY